MSTDQQSPERRIFMKKSCSLAFILALLLVATGTSIALAGEKYSAEMSGLGGSMASGKATFELDKGGTALH
jgi:hypothetical protein